MKAQGGLTWCWGRPYPDIFHHASPAAVGRSRTFIDVSSVDPLCDERKGGEDVGELVVASGLDGLRRLFDAEG